MRYLNTMMVLLMALLTVGTTFGQSTRDLRFNEILIKNTDNYSDEYGRHVPCVEIFNSAYNTVNLAGCYLTDDTTGLANYKKTGKNLPKQWYCISKSDANTALQQRTYAVFFLDAQPLYGTFHVNFDPRTSKSSYIALISADGKELIDMLEYPKQALTDSVRSFGRGEDVGTKPARNASLKADFQEHITMGFSNETTMKESKQERLKREDPYGIGLALISISVVFVALILIYVMLKIFGRLNMKMGEKSDSKGEPATAKAEASTTSKLEKTAGMTGEEAAAIATALHLHFNSMHDEESEIITIDMPSAHYSPWAQKGLVMKQNPKLRK